MPAAETEKAGRRAKGASKTCSRTTGRSGDDVMSAVYTDELELVLMLARQRVLKIQTKLHRWARDDPHRRFDDLFNLVADPAFLLVAWDRVSGNKGAATAGVDRRTRRPSRPRKGLTTSSTNYGRTSRTVVSTRCRCASG